ncbi:MAG TPA: hypothetical protein DCS87_16595 [Rheinheimera sp.]|nr:hypothetical protein [Rheinheimera sp.]
MLLIRTSTDQLDRSKKQLALALTFRFNQAFLINSCHGLFTMKVQYSGWARAALQSCFTAALTLVCASSLYSATANAGSVYMWKDKAGNVYFSDQPRDEKAQEVTITHNNAINQNQASPQKAPSSSTVASTTAAADDTRFDADMGSCDWLNRQLAQAKAGMNSTDEMTARMSRKFAADYQQALLDKRCPK